MRNILISNELQTSMSDEKKLKEIVTVYDGK